MAYIKISLKISLGIAFMYNQQQAIASKKYKYVTAKFSMWIIRKAEKIGISLLSYSPRHD